MIRAAKGDTVLVHYTGRLEDGTVFDRSPEERPLHFILGRGEVPTGFDEAVTGMFAGESKTFTVSPDKGYGVHDAACVEEIDRTRIPSGVDLHPGRQLEITGENGNRLLVLVRAVTDTTVTLDGNHPLAGRELTFDVDLLEVKKAPVMPPPVPQPKEN